MALNVGKEVAGLQRMTALAKCDGIADWLLLPNVEPGNEEVVAAFREWDSCEMRHLVASRSTGQCGM